MANSAAAEPPVPEPRLYLTPIVIALAILVSAALLLVALHFLLKELRDRAGPILQLAAPRTTRNGVSKEVLDSIPVQACSSGKREQECAVCLSGLEEGEMVRVLPSCQHVFHAECIDAWFASHSSCPFCRSEVTAAAAAAAEGSVVVDVEVDEEVSGGSERGGGECRRSNSLVCFDSFRLVSFREKLRLKRCLSLESSHV